MLARPRLDLHTLAVDFCLLVDEELATTQPVTGAALRRSSRATRESLARMCTLDETGRLAAYERARDACARSAAAVDTLHRGGRITRAQRDVAFAHLGQLMEKILDLALPTEEEKGRA